MSGKNYILVVLGNLVVQQQVTLNTLLNKTPHNLQRPCFPTLQHKSSQTRRGRKNDNSENGNTGGNMGMHYYYFKHFVPQIKWV